MGGREGPIQLYPHTRAKKEREKFLRMSSCASCVVQLKEIAFSTCI
jgi:hypothetical protein